MPAATTKSELLDVAAKEFDALARLLAGLDADVAMAKDQDDTSIKDTVAHRAHWIGLYLGWYHDGLAGETVHFPAEGYKWNDLKRYNTELRQSQADLTWPAAHKALHKATSDLTEFLHERSNNELYGGPMAGANNSWTPGRWAEAAGPSHFRSAAKYVRARLRDLG